MNPNAKYGLSGNQNKRFSGIDPGVGRGTPLIDPGVGRGTPESDPFVPSGNGGNGNGGNGNGGNGNVTDVANTKGKLIRNIGISLLGLIILILLIRLFIK